MATLLASLEGTFHAFLMGGIKTISQPFSDLAGLTLAKSTRPQIYYVKSGIWLGRPSVQYDI
jgi:hypothetical protein